MRALASWPPVSVVVLNWNGWRNTVECLESLDRLTYPAYEVIVVDNGSTDGSIDRIRAWAKGELPVESRYLQPRTRHRPVPLTEVDLAAAASATASTGAPRESPVPLTQGVTLIKVGENRGFTGGNNIGMRYALRRGAQWIFLVNNDAVVEPDALSELIRVASAAPDIGMVAPTVLTYANPAAVDRLGIVLTKGGLPYERRSAEDGPLLCPDGCAALYSRSLLDAVESEGQYFDEDFFAYGEDVDLGIRARREGFRAALAERGIVYHKGGASLGGMESAESLYLRHRNLIWIIVKNFPTRLLVKNGLWIAVAQIGTLARGLVGRGRRVVLQGKIDGIKGLRKACAKRGMVGRRDRGFDLPLDGHVFLPARRRYQTPGRVRVEQSVRSS